MPVLPALPMLPGELQAMSATQENPCPQSAAAWHGSRYLGTHCFAELSGQPASTAAAGGHSTPAAHVGTATAQFTGSATQAIPLPQSLSAVQGPGTHSEYVCGVHVGCWHVAPGAQAISGQAVTVLVWQT
jgi:hypothetical protein